MTAKLDKNQNLEQIISKNKLFRIEKNGNISFENNKNISGGMFIRINTEKKTIEISGSLHKFYNVRKKSNHAENYSNNLTLNELQDALLLLHTETGISFFSARLNSLEIGINLYLSSPPESYMLKMLSITPKKQQKFVIDGNIFFTQNKAFGFFVESS